MVKNILYNPTPLKKRPIKVPQFVVQENVFPQKPLLLLKNHQKPYLIYQGEKLGIYTERQNIWKSWDSIESPEYFDLHKDHIAWQAGGDIRVKSQSFGNINLETNYKGKTLGLYLGQDYLYHLTVWSPNLQPTGEIFSELRKRDFTSSVWKRVALFDQAVTWKRIEGGILLISKAGAIPTLLRLTRKGGGKILSVENSDFADRLTLGGVEKTIAPGIADGQYFYLDGDHDISYIDLEKNSQKKLISERSQGVPLQIVSQKDLLLLLTKRGISLYQSNTGNEIFTFQSNRPYSEVFLGSGFIILWNKGQKEYQKISFSFP